MADPTIVDPLPRSVANELAKGNPRILQYLEDSTRQGNENSMAVSDTADANETLQTAPVLTFGPSNTFTNERILRGTSTVKITFTSGEARLSVTDLIPQIVGGQTVTFITTGPTSLILPTSGQLVTTGQVSDVPHGNTLADYADDTAAAAGGVPVKGFYRTGSVVKIRVS